ncbi:MAG: hypothetical protein DRP19_03975 [Thermotogae bacterium]|nr:MAG: hypothetical protein DRP19_03975 [Thermotogota bacterium]
MDSYVLESATSISASHKTHFQTEFWFIFAFWSIILHKLTGNLDADEDIRSKMLYVGNCWIEIRGNLYCIVDIFSAIQVGAFHNSLKNQLIILSVLCI